MKTPSTLDVLLGTPKIEDPHGASVLPPVDRLRLGNPTKPGERSKVKLLRATWPRDVCFFLYKV